MEHNPIDIPPSNKTWSEEATAEGSRTSFMRDNLPHDKGQFELLSEKFEKIREKDFGRLDENGTIYLDYTGSSLAPKSLVEQHASLLISQTLGNPHSDNEPSQLATHYDHLAREKVLKFVKDDPEEYLVIWTPNASGALKLLGESYPFHRRNAYVHGPDCHNSVLGITEYAKNKKAHTGGFGFLNKSMCYDFEDYKRRLNHFGKGRTSPGLVAFPGESNSSGLKHNVAKYVKHAHEYGWDVCVDVAAYAPTTPIDIRAMGKPEYLAMSFYKIFGYPTGLGCLVLKKSAAKKLVKPWFAGGTVTFVGASKSSVVPFLHSGDDVARYEDGTGSFQSYAAVVNGIDYMTDVVDMQDLDQYISNLTEDLIKRLRNLKWSNGAPLVYIPEIEGTDERHGHAVSMMFLSSEGTLILPSIVERELIKKNISVRIGCFCNPSSKYQMLRDRIVFPGTTYENFVGNYLEHLKKSNLSDADKNKIFNYYESQGMLRVSLGIATNHKDLEALLSCLEENILKQPQALIAESKLVGESLAKQLESLSDYQAGRKSRPSILKKIGRNVMAQCRVTDANTMSAEESVTSWEERHETETSPGAFYHREVEC